MSLRKFMHSRNIYKKVPDFKQLALLYPEFRKIAVTDLTGKIRIDFKNETSLRILTEVLLKHDFDLKVKIPPNKLVPTLPLRLNYILWVEDLIKHCHFNEMKEVIGIDIGVGAVCIYPLLFAKMYQNRMIGTEVDESSVQTAILHIENNNLQHLIKIIKVNTETILKGIIGTDDIYDFTMCNPPFFEMGAPEKVTKRLPPRNAPTGQETELTVQGGERTFIVQMIEESMEIKEQVKIYTTMLGRRSNLLFLLKLLKKKNIENATWTEFCQGHTKRWGLAWTFIPKDVFNLTSAPVIQKSADYISKLLKMQRPTDLQFPMQPKFSSFDNLVHFLEETLEKLKVQIKEFNVPFDDFNGWSCQLFAENDTWSHTRRKRRLAQRQAAQDNDRNTESMVRTNSTTNSSTGVSNKDNSDNTELQEKHVQSTEETIAAKPFLVCNIFAEVIEHEDFTNYDVKISMVFENGSGGKNALETFRQYLINKLNIREHFQKQHAAKLNKKKRKRLKRSESDMNLEQIESSFHNDVKSL